MSRKTLPLCIVALALLFTSCNLANADTEPTAANPNSAFTKFIENPASIWNTTANDYHGGLIPEPFDLSNIRPTATLTPQAVLPSVYDLRSLNKLTAIRNQGSCGSCWDFAAIGSLESSLMPATTWDYSENNLKNLAGFDFGCCSGGNRAMASAYLARWGGPIKESDDLYNTGSCTSPSGLSASLHVQDIIFVPNRTGSLDNNLIKQAIIDYGAVYTTYYHSDTYYSSTNAAYYYNGATQSNHAVCIVGWDDSYPATNFRTRPSGNGAFLMRNSWGAYWGMGGYFWMSYYDTVLGKSENAVFRAEPKTNYDQIYQYDHLGWVANIGYGATIAWFANVFTATSNATVAAASWYSASPNASYVLSVYTNTTTSPINATGPARSVSGTLATAGYHTVKLPTGVPITAGQKFSVVVRLTTPGYPYPICLEKPYAGYSSTATASAGQSYISGNGASWTDVTSYYTNTNVCLKAFTTGASSPPPPTPGALSITPSTDLCIRGRIDPGISSG